MIGKLMEAGVDGVRTKLLTWKFRVFRKAFYRDKKGREIERLSIISACGSARTENKSGGVVRTGN
jgi:hypothetical protein